MTYAPRNRRLLLPIWGGDTNRFSKLWPKESAGLNWELCESNQATALAPNTRLRLQTNFRVRIVDQEIGPEVASMTRLHSGEHSDAAETHFPSNLAEAQDPRLGYPAVPAPQWPKIGV